MSFGKNVLQSPIQKSCLEILMKKTLQGELKKYWKKKDFNKWMIKLEDYEDKHKKQLSLALIVKAARICAGVVGKISAKESEARGSQMWLRALMSELFFTSIFIPFIGPLRVYRHPPLIYRHPRPRSRPRVGSLLHFALLPSLNCQLVINHLVVSYTYK